MGKADDLSTTKPSKQTGKLWLRLPYLSTAKSSKQTGKPLVKAIAPKLCEVKRTDRETVRLRQPRLSSAKSSERTGNRWLRLLHLSSAKSSKRTDRETDRNDLDRVFLVSSSCLPPG